MNIKDRKEKYCPVCDEVKSIDEFYKDKHKVDSKDGVCKECRKAEQTRLRSTPKVQEYQKEYQKHYIRKVK